QTADEVGGEAMTVGALAALTIEDARDDCVWIVSGQPPHQCDRVLIRTHDCRKTAGRVQLPGRESTAPPAHREMRAPLRLVKGDDALLKRCPQQLFLVAR